jgi:hypothetical protein
VAETNGLLNRRTDNSVPRVRIPPSPPDYASPFISDSPERPQFSGLAAIALVRNVLYMFFCLRRTLWGRMWGQEVDGSMAKLTAIGIRNLKQPVRYSDGNGLILDIGKSGRGSWIVRVQVGSHVRRRA